MVSSNFWDLVFPDFGKLLGLRPSALKVNSHSGNPLFFFLGKHPCQKGYFVKFEASSLEQAGCLKSADYQTKTIELSESNVFINIKVW